jgi:outer membrane receptor protein involved in Fe transport
VIATLAISTAGALETVAFDIEAGSAARSLNQYARQSGVDLGFAVETIGDTRTNEVKGKYHADQALELLLRDTGLVAIREERGLIISKEPTPGEQVAPSIIPDSVASESGDEPDSAPSSTTDGVPIEEILVTGSRIRNAQNASPIVTITRDEIDRAGYSTVGDVVESLPQNFGAGATQDTLTDRAAGGAVGGSVDNITAGQSVNLRGLGTGATLVLLNGRRMSPSGLSARFTDISRIPLSAVERVDVLTDGASAVYGSDAIAGVVNFVLRDNYEGAETRIKYGSDTSDDIAEVMISQAFGSAWETGSILASFEYYERDNLANTDRSFSATADLRGLGGTDWRGPGGNPANLVAGGQTYAIPRHQDGTSLSPDDFTAEAPINLHDFRAAEDLLPRQERRNVFLYLLQDAGPAELFAQVLMSRRKSAYRIEQALRSFDVSEANPFFVDPTGSGLTTVQISNYSLTDDLGPRLSVGDTDSYGGAAGVQLDIFDGWTGELVANWSREDAVEESRNSLNQAAFSRALASTDPTMAFNPFGDGSHTHPNVLEGLRTNAGGYTARQDLKSVELNIGGEVLKLARGRGVDLAGGIELRRESLATELRQGAEVEMPTIIPGLNSKRDVLAGYAELFLPIVQRSDNRTNLELLELSFAARYERYSDFGSTLDPKVGIVLSPSRSLTLRGTYGTSYRAPALFDLDTTAPGNTIIFLPQVFVDEGLIPFPTLVLQGGNENLKPEEATTWTAGIEFSPPYVDRVSLSATYFDIDFRNRIDRPFVSLLDGFQPRFASLLTLNPSLSEVAALASDSRYTESVFGTTTPAADLISGIAEVGGILNTRRNNLSKTIVTGVEVLMSYQMDTPLGTLSLGLNGSYLFDFQRALLATDDLVEEVGTVGRPIDFKARGSASWTSRPWTLAGYVNYSDGYTDTNSEPHRSVASWTTVDLSFSYQTGTSNERGSFLDNTRVSLTAQNVFQEDPPFVDTFGAQGYDSANATGLGRFVSLQVAKEW